MEGSQHWEGWGALGWGTPEAGAGGHCGATRELFVSGPVGAAGGSAFRLKVREPTGMGTRA